jgi:hypothetical protein
MMVRRRVADLWRHATKDANRVLIHWADLYRELLASIGALATDANVADGEIRERLRSLVAEHQRRKPPTRAQLVRDHLTLEVRPVRSLLSGLMALPWEATPDHPVLTAIHLLKDLYKQGARELPVTPTIDLGRVWRALLSGADREQAFRALEVATLLALRRALRNGTVWIDHSLAFRSRERLFIPAERWEKERNSYYRRLSLPKRAESYLEPLIERSDCRHVGSLGSGLLGHDEPGDSATDLASTDRSTPADAVRRDLLACAGGLGHLQRTALRAQ